MLTTPTGDPGFGINGAEGSLLGNGGKQALSGGVGGRQSPVDLPLRLASAVMVVIRQAR